jgi:alpha-tubulin suppressor-like RCC1 family protein
VYTFGWGELGQLGIERVIPEFKIYMIGLKNCIKINAGAVFSVALTKDGELYSWGSG